MEKLTPETIHKILVDRYHNNMTAQNIRKNYKLSHKTWKEIDETFANDFIERYGQKDPKATKVTPDAMKNYWKTIGGGNNEPKNYWN